MSSAWLAIASGAAGGIDLALEWTRRAIAERDPLVLWARTMPFWDPIRAHSGFTAVMGALLE